MTLESRIRSRSIVTWHDRLLISGVVQVTCLAQPANPTSTNENVALCPHTVDTEAVPLRVEDEEHVPGPCHLFQLRSVTYYLEAYPIACRRPS